MHITVRVKPNAKVAGVEHTDDGAYVVRVDAPPRDGKANARLVEILAEYFHTSKSAIRIVIGASSREKVIEIIGA